MKVIVNKVLPPSGYKAINLFGLVFVRDADALDEVDLNHEAIHSAQMKELLWIPFYLLYGLLFLYQWVRRGFKDWSGAYRAVAFEREAYDNEEDIDYLDNTRVCFAWFSYL